MSSKDVAIDELSRVFREYETVLRDNPLHDRESQKRLRSLLRRALLAVGDRLEQLPETAFRRWAGRPLEKPKATRRAG